MTRETGGMPELRLWARRALGAVVAVPASALLTVGSFGIAYGAASTSRASIWWLPLVLVLAAAIGIGFLIFLAVCLLSAFADDLGVLGRAVAYCVVLTTGAFFYALQVQAMHDRGQVERAVVTAVKYSSDSTGMGSDEWTAQLTDLSGRKLGSVDGSNLDVGDHLTVTVDPKGRFGVAQGSPPAKPRHLWDVAALLAVLQALLSSAKGFSTAGRTGSPS